MKSFEKIGTDTEGRELLDLSSFLSRTQELEQKRKSLNQLEREVLEEFKRIFGPLILDNGGNLCVVVHPKKRESVSGVTFLRDNSDVGFSSDKGLVRLKSADYKNGTGDYEQVDLSGEVQMTPFLKRVLTELQRIKETKESVQQVLY